MDILPPIEETELRKSEDHSNSSRSPTRALMLASVLAALGLYSTTTVPDAHQRKLTNKLRNSAAAPKHTLLYDDGTLFSPNTNHVCDYLTDSKRRHVKVNRLHYHFESCQDSSYHLDQYFTAHLMANAAQLPFTMTCGGGGDDETLLARLAVSHDLPGPAPLETSGAVASLEEICQEPNLWYMRDSIRESLHQVLLLSKPDVEQQHDMVIQVDSLVSVETYVELVHEATKKTHMDSIVLSGDNAEEVQHRLKEHFMDLVVHVENKSSFLDLYSTMAHASAAVCSSPRACGHVMLMLGSRGYLNRNDCPEWLLRSVKETQIELFGDDSVASMA